MFVYTQIYVYILYIYIKSSSSKLLFLESELIGNNKVPPSEIF